MSTYSIIKKTEKYTNKISVDEPDFAVEIIINHLIKGNILYFDNTIPVIRDSNVYKRITKDEEEALIFNLLDSKSQMIVPNKSIYEVMKRIRFIPAFQVDLTKHFWDSQEYINLKNGVYSITQQNLSDTKDVVKFDYCIDFNYIKNAKLENAPVFKRYVETSIGMEQYECLLRVMGYCISSLTKGRKAFVLHGIGRTGKSTILNVLESVIGPEFVSHEPFHTMSNERAKAHYEGKRCNISRETSNKLNRFEEGFKSLVSCEMVTGSEKFEKARDFKATLKFIFAGNTDVEFAHMDDAILDRLVYIMYTKEIPEEDIDLELENKLLEEKDVIFSLAVDKLKPLIDSKYDFKMSETAEEHLHHRRLMINSADSFLSEKTTLDERGKVSKVSLYAAYCDYCRENALKPDGRNTFYTKVCNFNSMIKNGRVIDSNSNSSVQGFIGIRLKHDDVKRIQPLTVNLKTEDTSETSGKTTPEIS